MKVARRRRLPDLLIGQHLSPRRHANAVFLLHLRWERTRPWGRARAERETDVAGAILAVAMAHRS
jgi:hypothetical protein